MSNPVYDIGQVVYLRESAAMGFLEAVKISGLYKTNAGWTYTIESRSAQPSAAATYGDRISFANNSTLYLSEGEFVTVCEALDLAEAYALRLLQSIQAKKQSLCGG